MGTNKPSHSAPAGFRVLPDFAFSESPDCPVGGLGSGIELGILQRLQLAMPVITIGLNDKADVLKHEVRLKPPEHRFVHLKLKAALLEFFKKRSLNGCHTGGEPLPQSRLQYLGDHIRAMCDIAQFLLRRLRMVVSTKPAVVSLSLFDGNPVIKHSPPHCPPQLFTILGRSAVLSRWHRTSIAQNRRKRGSI